MATSLVWLLLPLLCHGIAGQQLMYARDQRSLYELPSLDWNTVGSFSPIGLGHMTKDELLTLLEAWQDVEAETATPAPEPAETPVPPTKRPRKPPASAPARPPPPPPPAPEPAAEAGPALAPGRPVTVRLPALVPVQLAAMFTPPLAGGGGSVGIAGAAEALGAVAPADMAATELDQEDAAPRLFQFTQLPVMPAQQRSRPAQPPPVVRNTLESVDTGIAPLASLVKAKSLNARPKATPIAKELPIHQGPPLRPRFSMPPLPYLANAPGRLELVPSSQIIGDWRE
ncbi:hypothetical protein AWZ03_011650 [Drosophila navojoa]|uniref:Uncharacterized protein n=1 Tax=Drosophila navojoa TaxID=7232 RepID=A0A484AZA1_DRONA|nr:uncharacterized protein LOC108655925 [Drosophila navojoa]TDG41929.1 hypothetical protein AWZ03_011650 [Drosophila navojoa]